MSFNHGGDPYIDQARAGAAFVSGRDMLREERRALNKMLQEIKSVRKAGGDPETVIAREANKWREADVQLSMRIKKMVCISILLVSHLMDSEPLVRRFHLEKGAS